MLRNYGGEDLAHDYALMRTRYMPLRIVHAEHSTTMEQPCNHLNTMIYTGV